ncbi:hypothetical protein RHGRI_008687 [Rhododendron griersonianum]|uniref:Pentatricopeptide repeat-containing protein n=1 Tax=Rhododendron griersonianum TaxID=479676 RepID=A0AAV6L123_9ERIC|nr:hypothetical protein RHGRI_008687 [Rhododendron griersonianum]
MAGGGCYGGAGVGGLLVAVKRCENMEAALQVFTEMEHLNVVSWTSVVTGLAEQGSAKRALEMFQEMLDAGIKPNDIIDIAILSACSYVGRPGFFEEAMQLIDSMSFTAKLNNYASYME